ncbi:MAG: hypothetical protein DCC68_25475 [Planctomycetota bacterium]|nr:MAG: hypothetical protein DCC68_25475 [Planctomycetota bacterium]
MRYQANIVRGAIRLIAVSVAVFGAATASLAQPAGSNNNNISISAGPAGGIKIDAQGVVDLLAMPADATDVLRQKAAAMKAAPKDAQAAVVKPSAMRMISLTRLEKAIAAKLAKGERLDDEMQSFACSTCFCFRTRKTSSLPARPKVI